MVLSTGAPKVPEHLSGSVEVLSLSPQALVEHLSEQGASHIYVDGGKTIQRFLDAGMIDELTITRIPILLGTGIPLFGPLGRDVKLTHLGTRYFKNGFVQSRYRVPSSM